MIKLNGHNKIKTAVFISGNGTNLKSLIKFSLKKKSPIKIDIIFSNNSNAKGLNYARKFKIKFIILNYKNFKRTENLILKKLKQHSIELICLAGFMKILSNKFITEFGKKIINIHPSLLPKYKGLNTHQRVIEKKEKFTGCTVHYVNQKLDSGKIILQKKIRISKKDTPKTLARKVLKYEHIIYPQAIKKIFTNP
tara:strand:+ start:741 stop:1325 length:585 start_codon:yes stop_codon:yes gene_type:complete